MNHVQRRRVRPRRGQRARTAAGFDAATGEPLWGHPGPIGICGITTRVVCTVREGTDGVVTSIDPATGESETLRIPAVAYAVAVEVGLVVATDSDDDYLMAIDAAGDTIWETPFDAAAADSGEGGVTLPLTLAVIDDLLVVGGPISFAVDIHTGQVQPGQ